MEFQLIPETKNDKDGSFFVVPSSRTTINQCGLTSLYLFDLGNYGMSSYARHTYYSEKAEESKEEVEAIIKRMKEIKVLSNLDDLEWFLSGHKEAMIGSRKYGFKIHTENYSYYLTFMPSRPHISLTMLVYEREKLFSHLKECEKGISIRNVNNDILYLMPDGAKVRIDFATNRLTTTLKYVDEDHFLVGGMKYGALEFAREMAGKDALLTPLTPPLA